MAANLAGILYFVFFRLSVLGWPILAFAYFSSTLRLARNHDGVRKPFTICFAFLLVLAV
jgi:hypothetical protein